MTDNARPERNYGSKFCTRDWYWADDVDKYLDRLEAELAQAREEAVVLANAVEYQITAESRVLARRLLSERGRDGT